MVSQRKLLLQKFLLSLAAICVFAKPDCRERCGNLSIPYPFGTAEGCYYDKSFLITCNATTNTPYLRVSNIGVINISLDGQLTINSSFSADCYDKQGWHHFNNTWVQLGEFSLSSSLNKFIAVGCDTKATIFGYTEPTGHGYLTGCSSYCYSKESIVNGSCSGVGCCEIAIPKGAYSYNISLSSYDNHSEVLAFNPCSYAFVVEDGFYNFSSLDVVQLQTIQTFPVVVDWTIGNITCAEAQRNLSGYACKSPNSKCIDSDKQFGYLCNCSDGFRGNAYLPDGCQDIDECAESHQNDCVSPRNCRNTKGGYQCYCHKGHVGDGRKSGERCTAKNKQSLKLKIGVSVSAAISAILVVALLVILAIRKKEKMKQRESNFRENGGLMLEQLLSKVEQSEDQKARIYTENELSKATNKFDESQIIGQGGYGTVYRGTLENITVAIKKSKVVDRDQTEQFVNEVTVLSTIRHPSVVRLLGCCLETPVPLLVYEFITNNTLQHHLHQSSMGWETRLNIAAQTADALAYMHSDAPIHIIHRDIKSANILLDDQFQAKVSDFGVSRLVALDQTQLATVVLGTAGYIDPEYFTSGLLTDKSDVFSFGVLLAELLTGQKVICPDRPQNEKYLSSLLISAMKEGRLGEIIDARVKNEGDPQQLEGFADLARRCLNMKGEKRPSMKQVKRELEALKRPHGEVSADVAGAGVSTKREITELGSGSRS